MATLTETAVAVKKLIKISVLAIVILLVFKLGLFIFNTYLKVVKPPPPTPATVTFGKLPTIIFPEKLHPELTLRLETPSGGTPNLGDKATVYLMPTFRSNFMALDQAKQTAKNMNFTNTPKEITERRYRWESEEFLPSVLEMDIITGSFSLKRNWQADPTILSDKQLRGKEQAVAQAKNFLRQVGLLNDELSQSRAEITYLTFSAGQYQKAISLSEADFVQVDLFRADLDENKVLTPDPEKGIVRIIFSGSREVEKQIIQAEYNYFPVNLEQSGTYPIKTASQAWRELQTRQGFIASIGQNAGGVVAIRKIYLAYFDGESSNGFLLPIIVFEGDNGFYGYAQAINNEWLETAPAN
ncbi:MAG: hypothetical protein U0946_03475 [Patescibacteria group bacterium]|nr:hypothetical protein [Patescibacteria group bacterium]